MIIVSVLYIAMITTSIFSILSGVIAEAKKEPSKIHSGSVAISTVLLLLADQYKWTFSW